MKGTEELKQIVLELISEYDTVRKLYDSAGLDKAAKESALQGMVNLLQIQQLAIQNYANWKHIEREDWKINKKAK